MGNELKQAVLDMWHQHRGKTIGVGLGFLFGVSVLCIGFLKTAFLVICVAIGFWAGAKADNGECLSQAFDRLRLPEQLHWK